MSDVEQGISQFQKDMLAAFKHGLEFELSQSHGELGLETPDKHLPFFDWLAKHYKQPQGNSRDLTSRRFVLNRIEDETGISGTGYIADGTQFGNLKCVLCWRTAYSSIAVYDDIDTLMKIHGLDGKTSLMWVDPEVQEYSNRETADE